MPVRWKVVIASLILFVWVAVYVLWDLLDAVGKKGGISIRETVWGPSDMKKVWAMGIITALCFVVALAGDILTKGPSNKPST